MTLDELRRFYSFLGMQLMSNPSDDERKEIVGLRAIIKRELNLKSLNKNPNSALNFTHLVD